jgi:hypothetical protein
MTVRSDSHGGESESNPTAEAVESVSGYRDLSRIGHGGFSVVYRAVQESFERDVALKVLTVGSDEDAQRRFLREVRLASKLSGHPHVVTVLDTGTTASGRPYLAMDLYDGGSMKERLKRTGALPATEVALVGAKIADALSAAHSLGVLHRDVKPNNILVSRFGEPALADFGVSCLLDSNASASILDVFSPQHAAPELMARGVPSVSSDVYALGSTLYELLTGKPPFGADTRDVRAIMWRAMTEPAPRPECDELPALADAIVRAMAKEPADRFPDAADFAKTLRSLLPEGGASSTLAMTVLAPSAAAAMAAAPVLIPERETGSYGTSGTGPGTGTGAGFDPEDTSAGRPRGADETMVRPERVEAGPEPKGRKKRGGAAVAASVPAAAAGAGAGAAGAPPGSGGAGERDRRGRARTPLIVLIALCLLGAAVWVVLDSRNSSTGARAETSSNTVTASATPTASATHSASATPSHTATHPATHSAATATAAATHSAKPTASASAGASSTGSSGGLLGLGSYYEFRNAQSGECLTDSGSAAAQQSCGAGAAQAWSFQEPVTGILDSLAGDFELVNKQTGDCLTASGGSAAAQACSGGAAQLWSTVPGSSGKELHNAGSGQCLRSSGSGVVAGSCSGSDAADLWAQNGTS